MGRGGGTSRRSGTSVREFWDPFESLSTLASDRDDSPIPGDQPPSISTRIPVRPPTPGPSRYARGVSESRTSVTRKDNRISGSMSTRPPPGCSVFPFQINSERNFLPPPLERACSDLSKLLDPQCTGGIPFHELLQSLWRCSRCDNIMLEPFASRHTCPPPPEERSNE